MFPPPSQAKEELTALQARIEKRFKVLDVRYRPPEGVAFRVLASDEEIDTKFDDLRRELFAQKYVPFITREAAGVFILVGKLPDRRFSPLWVNLALFIATIVTTVVAGSTSWVFYTSQLADNVELMSALPAIFSPANLAWGALVFALPLMLILGLHELGHFYMARRHRVKASLPFFLPLPPIFSPLGTLGAFISVREPIPSRKALMDIGVTGPLVGFVVTIPVLLIGLWLTIAYPQPAPEDVGSAVGIGSSILFILIAAPFNIPETVQLHPTAFAGWVGLLVTALNLLPVSQLDGGHVARALFGERAKYLSIASFIILIILGIFFLSWWFFAILVLLFGLRHPPPLNDISPLDAKRKFVGWAAIVLLVVAFVPVPMQQVEPVVDAEFEERGIGGWARNMTWNETAEIDFKVRNTGNTKARLNVSLETSPLPPWHRFGFRNDSGGIFTAVTTRLAVNATLNLTLDMNATWDANTTDRIVLVTKILVRHEVSDTEMRTIASQQVEFRIRNGALVGAFGPPFASEEPAGPSEQRDPAGQTASMATSAEATFFAPRLTSSSQRRCAA